MDTSLESLMKRNEITIVEQVKSFLLKHHPGKVACRREASHFFDPLSKQPPLVT